MRYPTPHHLRDILDPHPRQCTERQLQGAVRCPCGSYIFALLYVGNRIEAESTSHLEVTEVEGRYVFCLGAKCAACGVEHLLYDDRFHGWNGYVCGSEEEREIPLPPYLEWHCQTCDGAPHKITLTIQGEDAKSAISEGDGILTIANWHEGFGWLTIDLTCSACKKGPTEIVSLETM
jgi:hypothetical protein